MTIELTAVERATVERFEAAEAAPESWSSAYDDVARLFHEAYERLAPDYGYETRRESAVPWEQVPSANRALMTAVCREVFDELFPVRYITGMPTVAASAPLPHDHPVSGVMGTAERGDFRQEQNS